MFETSSLYRETLKCDADVIVHQGGSSSGKTYSILQVLFTYLVRDSNIVITIVGESIPNLKAGALRDALDIYNNSELLKSQIEDYNRTDRIFTARNGSVMEFKSYETQQGAKSGKRDYLFINEAQGIKYDVFTELYMRTRKQVFIDYNPNAEFWVHELVLKDPSYKSKLFISDHRHNPYVSEKIREKIEGLRFKDIELFKVYARGMTGKIEGLVFRNFDIVDDLPLGAELIGVGLDWGFTNDPSVAIKVLRCDGELYLKELFYETGLINTEVSSKLTSNGINKSMRIVADSAEPKSIEELRRYGFNIEGAEKGADSIRASIDKLKGFKINITRDSVNLIKEFRSYKWDEKHPDKPVDYLNHGIDAVRYIALNLLNKGTGRYSFL